MAGKVNLTDTGTGPGEIFIFTDANYPGLQISRIVQPIQGTLKQGTSGFQSGNSDNTRTTLRGLNKSLRSVPPELEAYDRFLLWQDRRNSVTKYSADGHIACGDYVESCGKTSAELAAGWRDR
jgi:hypothetical protein